MPLTETEKEWLCRDSKDAPDPRGPQCPADIADPKRDDETYYCCVLREGHPGKHKGLGDLRWD